MYYSRSVITAQCTLPHCLNLCTNL